MVKIPKINEQDVTCELYSGVDTDGSSAIDSNEAGAQRHEAGAQRRLNFSSSLSLLENESPLQGMESERTMELRDNVTKRKHRDQVVLWDDSEISDIGDNSVADITEAYVDEESAASITTQFTGLNLTENSVYIIEDSKNRTQGINQCLAFSLEYLAYFGDDLITKTDEIFKLFDFINVSASTRHHALARRLGVSLETTFALDDFVDMTDEDGELSYVIESNKAKLMSLVHDVRYIAEWEGNTNPAARAEEVLDMVNFHCGILLHSHHFQAIIKLGAFYVMINTAELKVTKSTSLFALLPTTAASPGYCRMFKRAERKDADDTIDDSIQPITNDQVAHEMDRLVNGGMTISDAGREVAKMRAARKRNISFNNCRLIYSRWLKENESEQ